MTQFSLEELEAAAALVHEAMAPTPQIAWPLLAERTGCEVWVKHENHTPIGAFKVRGGLVYMAGLKRREPDVAGVTSATRGNHGQSIALAARRLGLRSVIYAPQGNSAEKNAAMVAHGAELVTYGRDFDEAREECDRAAEAQNLHFVPSFHDDLVLGVATYALELFRGTSDLDTVYVPIGMGSGICGVVGTRDLLGLKTKIVGVVSEKAPTVALSFETGELVLTHGRESGVAKAGTSLGELALFAFGTRQVTAVSPTGAQVLLLRREEFRRFLEDVPRAAFRIAEAVLAEVADRAREALR